MEKFEFSKEGTNKVTETFDEIVKFLKEKAKSVSEKEWNEIRSELIGVI